MLITESPVMWKILFDSEILGIAQTEVIFGSKFKNDIGSTIYLYRTIEKVRGAMQTGKVCVLLKLEQLYDSLYDVLNQRYLNVDNQKFCRICIGGESIRCQIHHTFRCIVVVPRPEAHHSTDNPDDFTPVAFLNRFEKQYLDPELLQEFGIGGNGWRQKWDRLKSIINRKYADHLKWRTKDLFIGFIKAYTFASLLNTVMTSKHVERKEKDNDNEYPIRNTVENCYHMLLKTTSIEYLIQDQSKLRKRDFIAYASLIDLLQREGVHSDSTQHMLLRVLTHDTYRMPLDFIHKLLDKDYDGIRVQVSCDSNSKDDAEEEESKINRNYDRNSHLHTLQFKQIASFMREMDFYNYVYDFLNNSDAMASTLIIICKPANCTEKLIHYLHAQYLTEKAREAAKGPHTQQNKHKNVLFLIYMSRQTPYPLIFDREWKNLFLDALLPADHQMFPQIQINDINIFELEDQRKFEDRVQHHIDRIVVNSYDKAIRSVVSSDPKHNLDEVERFKQLLGVDHKHSQDNGAFRKVLVERIKKIFIDKKSGAVDCLKKTLKNRKRSGRGSMREHVMEKLAEKTKEQLVGLFSTIFSNGNSMLYVYGDEQEQQTQEMCLAKLWLKLLSEPKIVHSKNTKVSIDRTLSQAQFPFSSQVHSYLSSYKDDVPVIESGIHGQFRLMTGMQNKLNVDAANLSVAIDNLPDNFVRKLSKDIVLLESTRLGLRRHGDAIFLRLIQFVDEFLWKSSNDVHEHVFKGRRPRKNMNDIDDEEEIKEDEHSVQIYEVYASLWANEKLILQCVDVLSVLKESPIRLAEINREWEVDRPFDACLVAIIRCLLDEVRDILIQGVKEEVDNLLVASHAHSFDDLLNSLATSGLQVEMVGFREEWNAIRQCISSKTYLFSTTCTPEFIHSLLPSLEHKLQLIKKKTSPVSVRTVTGTIIGQSWVNLNNKQQQAVQNACDELIQQNEFDIAASIINAIMESVDIYSKDKTDADIVLYLASPSGGKILKLLHRYKDHKELAIQCHINAFLQFWKQTLSNVDVILNHAECINAMVQRFGGIAPKSVPQYKNQNEGFCSMDQDDEKDASKVIMNDSTKSTLSAHTLRLKEWRKDETILQTICNSTDSINNYHFEDEKEDTDCTQWERLLHQRSKCNELIHTQYERLESLPQNVREVFVKQRAIKSALKQCEMEVKQHQDMMEQMKRQFSECHTKRKDLQRELVNTYKEFSNEMDKESILLQQQRQLKEKMDHGDIVSSMANGQCNESANIITSYQLYQKNTRIFMQKVQDRLQDECTKRETVWWEWTARDCLAWFRYRLEWFKEETIPRAIDINTIQKNMDQLGLTGRMLENIQKEQLYEIGFGFKQIDIIYPAMKHMCSSYPAPKMNEKDTEQTDGEGMIEETCNNNIDIPDRFKCTLTKQIMDHPVIAFDGHTYDKNAIISYLKQHHKSPISDEACVGDDEMSFMLFDDDKLKKEINLFKQANDL